MDSASGLHVELHQAAPIPLRVELSCREGEMLALVGVSGSGKTTILRTIAGLYRPRQGLVMCGGETWFDTARGTDVPPHLRRVGLVFQSYALFPHMTALRNVMTALGHRPSEERAARARAFLDQVHLQGLEDRRPMELSGGQQQRIAVARALAREPAVLLLDEPFSAVDRPTRRRLHVELAELRQAVRIPIVLVTHDIDEAVALADRICVLDRGETLQTGQPAELLAAPANERVAAALDLPAAQGRPS
jgi:molybdate transport system ATP-binding protein